MKNTPFEPGHYYHVFNRGNNKQRLFRENSNYLFFLQRMKRYLLPVCNILSYCLITNHFHFVIQFHSCDQLSPAYLSGRKKIHQPFANLFNSYAKSFNKRYNRTGSLFQEHLHRIQINSEDYLRDVILYTHLNPENHGLTDDFRYYKYSSYQSLVSRKENDFTDISVLDCFGGLENFIYYHIQKKYRNLEKLAAIEEKDY